MTSTTFDSPIKAGDFVFIPKGTELLARYNYGKNEVEKTSRDVTVEVSTVADWGDWKRKLTAEELAEYNGVIEQAKDEFEIEDKRLRTGDQAGHDGKIYPNRVIPDDKQVEWRVAYDKKNQIIDQNERKFRGLGETRFTQDDLVVSWSNNSKHTRLPNVTKVEKPAKKAPKVNIRQQMVKKSRWKVTQDLDIKYQAPNPAYHAAMDAWDKANPESKFAGDVHSKRRNWQDARQAERKRLADTLGEYIDQLYKHLPKDTIFTVVDKFNTYFMPYGWAGMPYTNVAPVLVDGEKDPIGLEYSMIKDFIEAESIPTVDIWVLRDKTTGLFYKGDSYSNSKGEWLPEWTDSFMKGKHFDNLGRAKTQILMLSGYYKGLPGADEALPDWAGHGSSLVIDDNIELVKFDKLGRKEIGPEPEFQEWFKRSWELRALTVKYGSSVRTCYKALEKAKQLETQKGMVIFTVTDQNALDNVGYYGGTTAITKEDQTAIDEAVSSTGMKKGSFKKATDFKSVAVSFPNKGSALMFKLAYVGNLKVTVIDLDEMTEVVEYQAQ